MVYVHLSVLVFKNIHVKNGNKPVDNKRKNISIYVYIEYAFVFHIKIIDTNGDIF